MGRHGFCRMKAQRCAKKGKTMGASKIKVLDTTSYEEYGDGIVMVHTVESRPPHEPPKGMIWHGVLGRFVPESWRDKEMWVDEKEVFGDEECWELDDEEE